MTALDATTPSLAARSLSVDARVRDITLKLCPGDCIVCLGPNGSGKSTLVRALLGLEPATHGAVTLDGRPLSDVSPALRAARVAWLPQRSELAEPQRIDELVMTGRYRFAESTERSREHALRALTRVGAVELATRRSDQVSGGELQRVLLATVLAQEAPLLLVDEPANHLDPAQQVRIYSLLGELLRQGTGLLVVTHDVNLARYLAQPERVQLLGLRNGALAFSSHLAAQDLERDLTELYDLPYRAVTLDGERLFVPHPARAARHP